jgi:REP element-mobilizing transposase RayT
MEVIFRDLCRDFDADLTAFTAKSDHVHLVLIDPTEGRL